MSSMLIQWHFRFSQVEYIETLARLMNITVEKHVDLFLSLATLIWLLADHPSYAEVRYREAAHYRRSVCVKNNVSSLPQAITNCPRTSWLLGSLHASISKKKNRLSVGNLNKSRKEQVAALPNSKPDWGLRQKRPRLFTTVHHAITSLIKRLKIETAT